MAMAMTSISLLLLFPLLMQVAVADNILLSACKTVGGGSRYFSFDFCMSALGSDGRSINAKDYKELALVAVDLITANATSTAAKIDGMLHGSAENATTQSLRSCQALYNGIVQRQPGCGAAIRDGKFSDATTSLDTSANDATGCEDGFTAKKVASPLTEENDDAFKLAKLVIALLRFA